MAAISLSFAGIPIPQRMQAKDYQPREAVRRARPLRRDDRPHP
jgi:hypothetical protein